MKRQMISVASLILLSSCSFQTEKENQTEDANEIKVQVRIKGVLHLGYLKKQQPLN